MSAHPAKAPAVAVVGIEDLRAFRALTDPELHPERRDEAERVSADLDCLIATALERSWPLGGGRA